MFYMCFTCVLHVFYLCFICVLICIFLCNKYMYIRQGTLGPPTVYSFWTYLTHKRQIDDTQMTLSILYIVILYLYYRYTERFHGSTVEPLEPWNRGGGNQMKHRNCQGPAPSNRKVEEARRKIMVFYGFHGFFRCFFSWITWTFHQHFFFGDFWLINRSFSMNLAGFYWNSSVFSWVYDFRVSQVPANHWSSHVAWKHVWDSFWVSTLVFLGTLGFDQPPCYPQTWRDGGARFRFNIAPSADSGWMEVYWKYQANVMIIVNIHKPSCELAMNMWHMWYTPVSQSHNFDGCPWPLAGHMGNRGREAKATSTGGTG